MQSGVPWSQGCTATGRYLEQSESFGSIGGEEATPGFLVEECSGSPTIVFLRGEIDIANRHQLEHLLDEAIGAHPLVVVDVADTTFVDGAILGVLAQANARATHGIRVRGASGFVARVFHLTEMDHLLEPDAQSQSPTGASPGL